MSASARSRVGRHRLVAKLEQGGMAEVYLAVVEDRLGADALRVVKVMPKSFMDEPQLVEMFLDEARLAVRLAHPNIVQTVEVGRSGGALFLAMEWLEGESLFRILQRARELAEDLPARAAVTIAKEVLEALHYLHELRDLEGRPLRVVHRDVTPSNIFLTTTGHVKLLDFGVAKTEMQHAVTVVGTRKGKLAYLAPEQLTGAAVDPRIDVYSCGVVLWEMLAGRRLWRGGDPLDRKRIAPRLDDARFGIPTPLADVCARALESDPEARFATAAEMLEGLERAASAVGGPARTADLAGLVESMVGEDIRNLRRLAANALRTGRRDEAGERFTVAPEGTSVTLQPPALAKHSQRRVLLGGALVGAAAAGLLFAALPRRPAEPAGVASSPMFLSARAGASTEVPPEVSPPVTPARVTLRVEVEPKDARVVLDGAPLESPSNEAELSTDAPDHQLQVSAPGYEPWSLAVRVKEDRVVLVRLTPLSPRGGDATTTDSSTPEPTKPEPAKAGPAKPEPARAEPTRLEPSSWRTAAPPWGARKLDTSDPW